MKLGGKIRKVHHWRPTTETLPCFFQKPDFKFPGNFAHFLDKLSRKGYIHSMKAMPVGELKAHFSEILERVVSGEKIGILYGRVKKPVAMIVPYKEEKRSERKIGILDGKATIKFKDNFEMTAEELCSL